MNFLAHLWLADQVKAPLAGAILGDVVRGRIALTGAEKEALPASAHRDFPAELARSILLHRRIDVSTDHHPRVRAAMAAFDPGARRYAGILLDLIYDHVLAREWSRFSDEAPAGFATRAAREVAQESAWFERSSRRAPGAWRFKRLLLSYRNQRGIDRAIARTASRLREPQGLLAASKNWPRHLDNAAADLAPLLQDLVRESQRFMLETPLPADNVNQSTDRS